jgi:type IV pilus assembly protein PilV
MLRIKKPATLARQYGFSLIEVMVTLAVLAIGLLGLAALQSVGIRFNHQSYQRTQAVFQAYDILDRMRTNWTCIAGGCAYSNVALGNIPGSPPNCISSTGSATCTNTQIATYDVAQWNTTNGQLLNTGRGAVCQGTLNASLVCTVVATTRTYWVAITWLENDLTMRIDVQAEL